MPWLLWNPLLSTRRDSLKSSQPRKRPPVTSAMSIIQGCLGTHDRPAETLIGAVVNSVNDGLVPGDYYCRLPAERVVASGIGVDLATLFQEALKTCCSYHILYRPDYLHSRIPSPRIFLLVTSVHV